MAECPEDKDMLDMATEELNQAVEEEKKLQSLLLKSLLPKDDADERDCILEVRAGKWRPCRWAAQCKFYCILVSICAPCFSGISLSPSLYVFPVLYCF